MKGIIFTSFIELVEERLGLEVLDEMLLDVKTKTNGAFTVVGTYDHEELVAMVVWLSNKLNIQIPELLKLFGFTLFDKLIKHHHQIVKEIKNPFEMFELVDPFIHKEVKKLYPEAETPSFNIQKVDAKTIIMKYSSSRKMADVAEGLIKGCLDFYKTEGTIERKHIEEDGSVVEFQITLQDG